MSITVRPAQPAGGGAEGAAAGLRCCKSSHSVSATRRCCSCCTASLNSSCIDCRLFCCIWLYLSNACFFRSFANPSSCNHRIVQQGVSTVRHNKVQQNTPPKTHARKHTPTDSGSSLPPNSLLIDSGKHADTMVDLLLFRLLRTQCPNVSSTTVHAAVSCD